MSAFESFLESYGLIAIFVVMLVKSAGVPIPVPSDVIMLAAAVRAADGRLSLPAAFGALWLALVVGGVVQFALAGGPGRQVLYRYGRYLGLTPGRLDRAAAKLKRGGPLGVGMAILTPGVRAAAVAACGIADVPVGVFVPGLVLGSTAFLGLHFTLGYAGGSALAALPRDISPLWLLALLAVGFAAWLILRRRQRPRATVAVVFADAFAAWHEATCPACLALGSVRRLEVTSPTDSDPV